MKLIYPILFLAAAIPIAEQAIENWLSNDSEARWVPFTLTSGNQIRFTATVDGRPVGAILDTGVSDSALSRRLSPRSTRPGTAVAFGGAVPSAWAASPRVAFGGLDHRGGRIAVVDAPSAATGGESVDLFVGRGLLAGFALEIDYDAGRFRLLLDPGAGQMVLAPGRLAGAQPPRSTSGLLLRRDGDRLNVVHVMRGAAT